VHRIGRTGRAGSSGEAVSLVAFDDRPLMSAIEKLMARKVELRVIAGFEPGNPLHQQPRDPGQRQDQRRPQPQRHQQRRPQQHNQRRAEGNRNAPQPRPVQQPRHTPVTPGPSSRPTGTPAPAPRPKQGHEQRRQVPALFGGQRRQSP
jgi:ATP-dependent RNA helicase RhlE